MKAAELSLLDSWLVTSGACRIYRLRDLANAPTRLMTHESTQIYCYHCSSSCYGYYCYNYYYYYHYYYYCHYYLFYYLYCCYCYYLYIIMTICSNMYYIFMCVCVCVTNIYLSVCLWAHGFKLSVLAFETGNLKVPSCPVGGFHSHGGYPHLWMVYKAKSH